MSEKRKAYKEELKAAKQRNDTEYIKKLKEKNDFADAAFKKKVTIFNACLLLVFIIGVCTVIIIGWNNRKQADKRFDEHQAAFLAESQAVREKLEKIEADGGTHEDKRQVKIEVTDDNFVDWISLLDVTYNCDKESEDYAAYGGAEIHLQGLFVTRKFTGGTTVYWVYRNHHHDDGESHNHSHDEHDGHDHAYDEHDAHDEVASLDGLTPEQIGEMIPIEVILDEGAEIPENGAWVDVVGVVGPDTFKNLSGVRDVTLTVVTEHGNEYVEG